MSSDTIIPVFHFTSAEEIRPTEAAVPRDVADFVLLFTRAQRPLYLFILGQTGNVHDAEEVLQNANVVIWKKSDQFEVGTNFFAWACQIARFEVLQYRQRHRRDKLKFSEEFLDAVSRESVSRQDDLELQRQALDHCIRKLSDRDQILIRERYQPGSSGKDLASDLGRPANSVYQSLGRIRRVLLECIQRRITEM